MNGPHAASWIIERGCDAMMYRPTGIRCPVCGQRDAYVEDCETAKISGRAWVRCGSGGHSGYRAVTRHEIAASASPPEP